MLRPLPVDLEELAGILEADPVHDGGRVDLTTGEVWPQAAIEYALETGEEDEDTADDPERWLLVHGEGSREAYRDMELFIASVEPDRAERLATAIKGRGAFRRFKDELARWPGELERWYALSEERRLGRARSWLTTACCPPPAEIPEVSRSTPGSTRWRGTPASQSAPQKQTAWCSLTTRE